MMLALLYLASYLLGAIPFAVIIGRMKGVDIFNVGSGNPGMTNVMRALGPTLGILCFLLDVGKGLLPTLAARMIAPDKIGPFDPQLIWFSAGLAAILGHCCSIFLRFKGGKGVSAALGAIVGTSPIVAACCFGLFLFLLAVTRYMSLASVVGVCSVVVFGLIVPDQSKQLLPIFIALSAFVVYRHRRNLKRLREGTEPKFTFRQKATDPVESPRGSTDSKEPLRSSHTSGKETG
jgi:glycerol-3-phosphate acyltransferase PlsY